MRAPNDIAEALLHQGFAIKKDFIDTDLAASLARDARDAYSAGRFHAAGVGGKTAHALRSDIRGDHILWLDTPVSGAQRDYLARMEALRLAINERLYLGLFDFECHFARYPPGSFYQRHVDRFRDDFRRTVSAVLYLNEIWDPDWGGSLRIYESEAAQASFLDIAPLGGTLVCFRSDSISHEVLMTSRERLSLTGWFRRRNQ